MNSKHRQIRTRPAPTRLASLAVILALATTGVMALGGGRALASHVSCGDTITVDTTLDSDLVDCPNNGIVIGAEDITLDLDGHVIDGDGTPFAGCPQGEFCDGGVLNQSHDGVTVTDGRVREFGVGVFVGGSRHSRVLGASSSRNEFAGFGLVACARSVVRNSSGHDNVTEDGDGMFLIESRKVRILHNSFRHNKELGIHVGDSDHNLIKGNRLSHSQAALLMQGNRNRLKHNRIRRSDGNIIVSPGDQNVIARNRIFRGVQGARSPGIAIEEGRDNLVANNVVAHLRGPGIELGLVHPLIGGSNNVVRRNLVKGSGGDGLLVEKTDHHSRLRRNVAVRAEDDGIDVNSPTTRLWRNKGSRNADLGIEAVRGVIDGGGNVARHNGDARQCTHISCR